MLPDSISSISSNFSSTSAVLVSTLTNHGHILKTQQAWVLRSYEITHYYTPVVKAILKQQLLSKAHESLLFFYVTSNFINECSGRHMSPRFWVEVHKSVVIQTLEIKVSKIGFNFFVFPYRFVHNLLQQQFVRR